MHPRLLLLFLPGLVAGPLACSGRASRRFGQIRQPGYMGTAWAFRKWFPASSEWSLESECVYGRGQKGVVSLLGHRNPWSGPEGKVFWAGKSGRSLQRATRGGACVRECVRVASPGSRLLLQSVSMTRSWDPQAARGGD